jgi:hypothetical protein
MADTKWKMFDTTVTNPLLAWTLVPENEIYNAKYIHGISIPSPVTDRVLYYNGATFTWESMGGGGPHGLGSHTDVDLSGGVTGGDVLTYNGTTSKWEPGTGGSMNTFFPSGWM